MQPLELRLVHAADLHLGYTYAGLPARQRQLLINDEPRLLVRLVDLCLTEKVDGLLLAGDVFEHDRPDRAVVDRFHAAVTRLCEAGIYVFVTPGNHDPYWPDSPWATEAWPDRFICFSPDRGAFDWRAKRAVMYGAAFTDKLAKVSLIDELLPAPTDRKINVLCLHGDVVGEGQISGYNPIRRRLLDTPQLDYAALGHVHKGRHGDASWPFAHAAYAGSWRGRGFDETGRKGVYLVTIRKDVSTLDLPYEHALRHVNIAPGLTFVPLSDYAFVDAAIEREGPLFSAETIYRRLERIAADLELQPDHVLWRVRLIGDCGDVRPSLAALTAALEPSVLYIEITDLSVLVPDQATLSEHSLQGAFLRASDRSGTKDDAFMLAVELGLQAFDGPLDLSRFFAEPEP